MTTQIHFPQSYAFLLHTLCHLCVVVFVFKYHYNYSLAFIYEGQWTEDIEETFPVTQTALCPPVYYAQWSVAASHCYCLAPSRKALNTNFYKFYFGCSGNRAEDALFTRSLLVHNAFY